MARRIPLVAAGVLHVLEPPGGPEIAVDSPGWAAWLRDPATRSFSFRGSSGAFTARKEGRSGGEEYWSAYRKLGGKLRKVYLGKAERLTLARLEDAATVLALAFDWATRHPGRTRGVAFMETIVRPMSWEEFPEGARPLFESFRTPGVVEDHGLAENVFIEQALPRTVASGLTDEDMDEYR